MGMHECVGGRGEGWGDRESLGFLSNNVIKTQLIKKINAVGGGDLYSQCLCINAWNINTR